ncbi:MAG: class I SAM-dependent methyltransferase [Candidatus Omnitrophica bacterium]|nr:class I SAM-dependent methyltransferase [Candidatus Omnitrophota bacterium]
MAQMTMREKLFKDYLFKNDLPKELDHTVPNKRSLEGCEAMFLKFIPPDKNIKILDVGCGCGQLLYMLREHGYNRIKGVDLGQAQIDLTKKLGIEADKIDDLPDYLDKNYGWDVVVMNQVIEHFPKDKVYLYLDAIKKSIVPGGKIIIGTPNMALLSGGFQRYIDFTHEIGFTERSLRQVLKICGFEETQISGEVPSLKFRPKFLVWFFLRSIWFKMLSFLYLLERGTERPGIISRHLIAVAKKSLK